MNLVTSIPLFHFIFLYFLSVKHVVLEQEQQVKQYAHCPHHELYQVERYPGYLKLAFESVNSHLQKREHAPG